MPLSPHALHSLTLAILKDLRVGQSTSHSTAGRISLDVETTTTILTAIVTDGLATTVLINDTITVYRITPSGLDLIS